MNRLGGKSNTGEGGEDLDRFTPDAMEIRVDQLLSKSQVEDLVLQVITLSIQMKYKLKLFRVQSQGRVVNYLDTRFLPPIAKTRGTTPGVGLISPPPHHDIYSIEDLAELIHDLKNSNIHARVNVKLVSEVGVGTVAAGLPRLRLM
jgi:glutamate synthase domain-containing protein 2